MTKKRGLRAAQLLALTLVLLLLCACGKVDHNEDETSNLGHWGRALAALSMQTLGGEPCCLRRRAARGHGELCPGNPRD